MAKIVDFELGVKLAGGREKLAKQMLKILLESIPENEKEISEAYLARDLKSLAKATHKLHGAASYCGTPRLKDASIVIENMLVCANCFNEEIDNAYKKMFDELMKVKQELEVMDFS
jgi:two-component system sensor histidine kinase BarA